MKKLTVACDGTWNTPDQRQFDLPAPTNVVRLHNAIATPKSAGREQRKYYHPGVGTDGSLLDKAKGGAYGRGLGQNVLSAYAWLARNYAPGDQIYLFGFSRGAFTVRSLGGFIGRCGLLDLTGLAPQEAWRRVEVAYQVYQDPAKFSPSLDPAWKKHPPSEGLATVRIHFIGVWDTVGALGVPDDLALFDFLDNPTKWEFHDTQLGAHVTFARHAVAIDEQRAVFTPTLWTDAQDRVMNEPDSAKKPARVRQLWFPGAHADVGGGYAHCGLSDVALDWMIREATRAGLEFERSFLRQIKPDFQGVLHDSYTGAFSKLQSRPRNRPPLAKGSPYYHASAWQRDRTPPITQAPYHPPTTTLAVGETSAPFAIYARQPWNETGLFLEPGRYRLEATGQWLDKNVACGPEGTRDGKFTPGELAHLAGSLWGKVEDAVNALRDKPGGNFAFTKRHEDLPWFCLVAAIANDGPENGVNPSPDGSAYPHQTSLVGRGTEITVKPTEEGYLYAYANDAWNFYENNRGSVTLTVTRLG